MEEPQSQIHYRRADERLLARLYDDWGALVARHLHFADGVTLLAWYNERVVGLISLYWLALPLPVENAFEGYIDIIEVRPSYRRRGIATRLIDLAAQQARGQGAYQLRAWSSLDKLEAIPMWQRLGFGLCPASTYPRGQEVKGYFVTRVLGQD